MTNVFEGAPDGCQSDDQQMPTSRFRPRYRALSDGEKALHDMIKAEAEDMERLFRLIETGRNVAGREPRGREIALALTKLEESIMWAIKALTA